MNMQTPTGNEQRASTTALRRGNRMETRAGSAAGSTHCSGNLPLSALPAPAPPEPLSASARPFPRTWGWSWEGMGLGPRHSRGRSQESITLCIWGGSAEGQMKSLELPQPVCLLLALPTLPACPQDWDGAAAEPERLGTTSTSLPTTPQIQRGQDRNLEVFRAQHNHFTPSGPHCHGQAGLQQAQHHRQQGW